MTYETELFKPQDGVYVGFADNPAVVILHMETADIASAAKMKRVVLTVAIGDDTFPFESEFVPGEDVTFDISSAWVSAYRNAPLAFPNDGYTSKEGALSCHTEGLLDGEIVTHDIPADFGTIILLRGGVPQGVLHEHGWTIPDQVLTAFRNNLTLKPRGGNGEVYNLGDTLRQSVVYTDNTKVTTHTYECKTEGIVNALNRRIKVVDDPRRVEFAFINSFGVIEHVSAVSLSTMTTENESTEYGVIDIPSFAPANDVAVKGTETRSSWKMSSGYADVPWLLWWANEFLPRRRSDNRWWMRTAQGWLPVIITAKSSTIYDISKGEMKSVDFDVKSAVEGFVGQVS